MTVRPRPPLHPDDRRHGTPNGYNNHHCHCDTCTDAWATTTRTRRWGAGQRTRAEYLAACHRTHGIRATYTAGCRCTPCKTAERDYRADYRHRTVTP